MNKAFKYRLYPNKSTEKKLYFVLNRCRELYNAALSERKDAYQYAGKSISWFEQKRDLPEIKTVIRPEHQEIGSHILQDVLHRLNKAFDNFFRKIELKKKGSHRRERAKRLVGKAHRKIARQRRDFLHKQSRKLVNHFLVMVFEDLQIGNLTTKPKPKQDGAGKYLPNGASAKGGLNKSILDAGWGMFMQLCASKAECAGRTIVKVSPQFTSQVCSNCGQVRKKDLSERWHSCDCGAELERDVNAAINILARGKQRMGGKHPTSATA